MFSDYRVEKKLSVPIGGHFDRRVFSQIGAAPQPSRKGTNQSQIPETAKITVDGPKPVVHVQPFFPFLA